MAGWERGIITVRTLWVLQRQLERHDYCQNALFEYYNLNFQWLSSPCLVLTDPQGLHMLLKGALKTQGFSSPPKDCMNPLCSKIQSLQPKRQCLTSIFKSSLLGIYLSWTCWSYETLLRWDSTTVSLSPSHGEVRWGKKTGRNPHRADVPSVSCFFILLFFIFSFFFSLQHNAFDQCHP